MKVCWLLLAACYLVTILPNQVHNRSVHKLKHGKHGHYKLTDDKIAIVEYTDPDKHNKMKPKRELSENWIYRREVPDYTFVTPLDGTSNKICFDCDPDCQAALGGSIAASSYFLNVTQGLNTIFAEVGITFYSETILTADVDLLDPDLIVDPGESADRFIDLLDDYWYSTGLVAQRQLYDDCDINILAGKDPFFDAYNEITGVTYLMRLCSDDAVVVQRLFTYLDKMVSGIAHEVGHLMGMLHTRDSVLPFYEDYPDVIEQCPDVGRPTCGTEQNYDYLCIMIAALPSGYTPPNEIAVCSLAQMVAFFDLRSMADLNAYPMYRDLSECLLSDSQGSG